MFLYSGSLEESHQSPNGQSQGEEVEGEAGLCVGGVEEMAGGDCREEDLVMSASEACGRDAWEANKQGGGS